MTTRSHHAPALLPVRQFFAGSKASICINGGDRQPDIPEHRHEFFEIAVIRSGRGTHRTGYDRRSVTAGDVFVLNPQRAHSYEATSRLSLVNILIRRQAVARLEPVLRNLPGFRVLFAMENKHWRRHPFQGYVHLAEPELEQALRWIELMEKEVDRDAVTGTLLAESYLALFAGMLARRQATMTSSPPRLSGVNLVCQQLEHELENPPDLPFLAQRAGLSRRTVERRFKVLFGITPSAYGRRMRLLRAAELLQGQGDTLSIGEIATRCGFEDSNYFSRAFHRATGISPREYRRSPHQAQALLRIQRSGGK